MSISERVVASEPGSSPWVINDALKGGKNPAYVLGVLAALRSEYLLKYLSRNDRRKVEKADLIGACVTSEKIMNSIQREKDLLGCDWGDWRFHLRSRLHLNRSSSSESFNDFLKLAGHTDDLATLIEVIREGIDVPQDGHGANERRYYDLSILPLNLLLGERVLNYFIPPKDYLKPHITKRADPYGLLWAPSRASAAQNKPVAISSPGDHLLLGSHKFTHTLLMNIDFYCPIGCSDCYKTRLGTREYTDPLSLGQRQSSIYRHPEFGEVRPPNAREVSEQARRVVGWMNEDLRGQTVYDVIISGGEPLILSNEKLGNLLEELGKARNLRILRICTGTLFLGLPMRIDDELVDILDQFSNETGVRVTIQAHLACHEQIVPESVIAVSRLRKRGINIYTQVPIKEGINFFADDLHRTVKELALLGKKQVAIGVEPYMFIVDMHPSTNAFYVPIEPLICVWGALVESHDYPGLERPRTLSILFEGGNIILSGNTMLAMTKAVDKDRGIVTYRIPRVGPDQSNRPSIAEVFEYSEPLGPHNENPDSLGLLRERWLALRY